MPNEVTTKPPADIMERVLLVGDLGKLTPDERVKYYGAVCESVGLNPLTRPFDYLQLNGKTVLYANRNCGDQLRQIHGVSIEKLETQMTEGVYVVTAYARNAKGRTDSSIGAVPLGTLKGEALANALMKAETKSKRRVTLSICGLSFLDETEVDSIPDAQRVQPDLGPTLGGSSVDQARGRPPIKLVEDMPLANKQEGQPYTDPAVAQPAPPIEVEVQPAPTPEADVQPKLKPETKQAIFKAIQRVNKKLAGHAQAILKELYPQGCDITLLTDKEGQALIETLTKGLE